ncbi:hypothetical protein COO60DRAFT_200193 [Scenedesmus sp. NREL 46B-D3]|nr:hypothetical protein COO60DRAFT_200193 [Scenedesmus sp. NREL 46B-D3]
MQQLTTSPAQPPTLLSFLSRSSLRLQPQAARSSSSGWAAQMARRHALLLGWLVLPGTGSGIHVVSDNDLFKPKTPQRLGMAAKQQRKTNLVQTLDPAEASRLLSGRAAAGQQQQQQGQQAEPYVQLQIALNAGPAGEAPVKVAFKLLHPLAAAAAAKKAAAAAAAGGAGLRAPSTSSVGRLPGARRQFGAGIGARSGAAAAAGAGEGGGSGSGSISALLGGAWTQAGGGGAAAAAAAGGEGAEPAGKRARKAPQKRVAWRVGPALVAVRWFVKDDPPAQACKDATLTDEQRRALASAHTTHHHAAFDQAARMEHQRERQIIEQQHKEAEEEAARLRQRVDAMQPSLQWYGAAPEVPLDASWQVAAGEGSTEAQRWSRTLPQLLAKLQSAAPALPGEPQESHQLLQPPSNALFNVAYHDSNVKLIPLNTVVQQQQQQQAPQQQQPVVLQAPLQQQPVPMQQQASPQGLHFSQGGVMQQQQQQQQQALLQGLQPVSQQQQPQQLVMQPIPPPSQQQQQQLGGPPPPAFGGGQLGVPPSSGPPSSSNQAQLLQALQSLQSQGGLAAMLGLQPSQHQQQQQPVMLGQHQVQQQQQPVQLAPGQMPPGSAAQPAGISAGMQIMLPNGMMAVVQGQQGQPLQLPPGVMLAPMLPQQQQQPPALHVQSGPYEQAGHVYEQPGHIRHSQHLARHEYGQQQWDRPKYEGGGYRGHGGGGGGGSGHEEWRRNKRECKFFNSAAGCRKGDAVASSTCCRARRRMCEMHGDELARACRGLCDVPI